MTATYSKSLPEKKITYCKMGESIYVYEIKEKAAYSVNEKLKQEIRHDKR